ncbi:bifunctional DNA primase/polymerase [Streptomyces massasporeus]|uniref:bifunctional DNA primase/polymerase n=1 Tax=Streptomyces massasporeus TaxID=67324 RepID=UPI0037B81BE8
MAPSLAIARWCAAKGWPVHPLAVGRKTPAANCPTCQGQRHDIRSCPCLPAGRPCHSFHAATLDSRRITTWWSRTPQPGVGVACGPADLVVLDIDAHPAEVPSRDHLLPGIFIHNSVNLDGLASGYDTLALLSAFRRQPNPAQDDSTLRVRTPSGGLHVWYRLPSSGPRFRSSTGSSPKVALAWQVDVRSEGGYIIAPAVSTSRGTYRPLDGARVPSRLPDWLAAELIRTGHVSKPTPPLRPPSTSRPKACPLRSGSTTAARGVLQRLLTEVIDCAAQKEGTGFAEKLNRAAFTAGGLIAAGQLVEPIARDLLVTAARSARPWQMRRNTQIIDSGIAAGTTRPFHLKGR